MRLVKILSTALLLVIAICAGGYYYLTRPFAGFQGEVFVEIPKGSSARGIARRLASEGVIEFPQAFLAARVLHPSRRLQAGEYRFAEATSPLDVFQRIARGDIFYQELVIPEGLTMFDVASAVERAGLMSAGDFLAAARDPSPIRDLAPRAPTLEGYLFPDTYRVAHHTSAQDLCRMFTQRFRSAWKQLNTDAGVNETVTLASLIEKEAAVPEERPIISSVFHNRLKLGMKLDCDPTTVYAALLDGRFRGVIHQSDLASENPYNTYQHAGLPPGPIANPGLASLKAALHPGESDFLYFVARPDSPGHHQFSKDIAAHRLAANRYRRAIAR